MDPTPLLLTILLASSSCPVRDAAERVLSAEGVVAYPALVAAERSADPEVRQRTGRLLDMMPALVWDTWLAKNGPPPIIKYLPRDYSDEVFAVPTGQEACVFIYCHYLNRAEWNQTTPREAIASEMLFRELIEARRFRKAEKLLADMRTNEAAKRESEP